MQCSQPGCAEISNYRKELQLLTGASDDKESRSSTSERGQEDLLGKDAFDQEIDLAEGEMAEEEPDQDRLDELCQYKDAACRDWQWVSPWRSFMEPVGTGDGWREADMERNWGAFGMHAALTFKAATSLGISA